MQKETIYCFQAFCSGQSVSMYTIFKFLDRTFVYHQYMIAKELNRVVHVLFYKFLCELIHYPA